MITDIGQFLSMPPFKPYEWPSTLEFQVPFDGNINSTDPKVVKPISLLRTFLTAKGYLHVSSSLVEGRATMRFSR